MSGGFPASTRNLNGSTFVTEIIHGKAPEVFPVKTKAGKSPGSALAGTRDVNVNLPFPIPSMNRINQTKPLTFSILSF
jgi:hypothetical protein